MALTELETSPLGLYLNKTPIGKDDIEDPSNDREFIVAFDQHGTYRKPRIGSVHCHRVPITDKQAEMLMDTQTNWNELVNEVQIFGGLSTHSSRITLSDFRKELIKNVWRYKTDSEQERALADITRYGLASCTMVSGMHAKEANLAWRALGEKGRESVDINRQMILRRGPVPMLAKLIAVGILLHQLNKPPEKRNINPPVVLVVDDDPNFTDTVSRLYQLLAFSPITEEQKSLYPALRRPGPLEGMRPEVYMRSGLPEVAGYLRGIRTRERILKASDLIMAESQLENLQASVHSGNTKMLLGRETP